MIQKSMNFWTTDSNQSLVMDLIGRIKKVYLKKIDKKHLAFWYISNPLKNHVYFSAMLITILLVSAVYYS